jgi:transposase
MPTIKERRDLIKGLWKSGIHNVSTLQKTTGFPRKTLYRWVKQLEQTKDLKQGSRPGRPTHLTPPQRCHLGRIAKLHKLFSSSELTEKLKKTYPNLNIATRTVRENLQKLDYRVCIPRSVPFLTSKAMNLHVIWAKAHQRKNWNKVIFSDESSFQMFRNTTQVRYKCGESIPRRVTVKHPFKVHVWGAFCAKGIVGFHMFTENMNGELYREIVTENLFEQASQVLGRRWTFQQDNDPKHRAKLTMALLQDRCPRVLDWPSSSPDLNPIENLWSTMKQRVEKKVNLMISEKKSVTQEIFMSIIAREWEAIDKDLCLKLAKSMSKRVELVIESQGRTINY